MFMETQLQFENTTQQAKQQHSPAPSSSSSPSHEFTFTISLNPTADKIPDKNKLKSSLHHQPTSTAAAAVDLSPADEIFFHGQLLPLHLVSSSNLPIISPRSSTNSLGSITRPVKDQKHHQHLQDHNHHHQSRSFQEERRRPAAQEQRGSKEKSKSFSLFGNIKKEEAAARNKEINSDGGQGHRKKSKLEIVKRYLRLVVKPYLTLKNNAGKGYSPNNSNNNAPRPYSLSSGDLLQGNKNNRREMITRGKNIRGDQLFSAPASMRVSPTNSGRLNVPSGTISPINSASKSDSTMEELQAAIQAAIAHCKKSIDNATEDTIIRLS